MNWKEAGGMSGHLGKIIVMGNTYGYRIEHLNKYGNILVYLLPLCRLGTPTPYHTHAFKKRRPIKKKNKTKKNISELNN